MHRLGLVIASMVFLAGGAAARDKAGSAGIRPVAEYRQDLPIGAVAEHVVAYANHPLDRSDNAVRRVLVVVHGAGRNADDYFRSAMAAAYLSGALDDTLVVAPRFSGGAGDCQDEGRGRGAFLDL